MKATLTSLALVFAGALNAAHLQPETLNAWDDYVQDVNARNAARLQPGATFLWVDESSARVRRIYDGEAVSAPVATRKVPSGLIHPWIGAVFIPNARPADVFSVLRDYRRYKEFYPPAVMDSKTVCQDHFEDQFSITLMNKVVVARMALEGDYRATYFPLDGRRWYSITRSARLQEIQNYGQSDERKLAPGEGLGYIWRLYTISRFEERDGGVAVEIEALALSRDIPVAVRWLVNPVVERVSRNSLVTSLRQTSDAVSRPEIVARRADVR